MSLATEFRPTCWSEVVGQPVAVATMRNMVKAGKVQPTHVLHGPRGTGKTTAARILAAALNCERQDGDACRECASCRALADGSSLALIEMDAASHGLVDDVRRIRDEAQYVSMDRCKVYCLDECQSMSPKAWEAALKILEEPPENVVFLFCTTELHKVPATVLSRAFVLPFNRVGLDLLVGRLELIAKQRGLTLDREVLTEIAQRADGSVRDSISLLEQVSVLAGGEVTSDTVAWATGTASWGAVLGLTRAVLAVDTLSIYELTERAGQNLGDLSVMLGQMVELCQAAVSAKLGMKVDLSNERRAALLSLFERLDADRIIDLAAELTALYERVRRSRLAQGPVVSVGLVRIAKGSGARQAPPPEARPAQAKPAGSPTTLTFAQLVAAVGGKSL